MIVQFPFTGECILFLLIGAGFAPAMSSFPSNYTSHQNHVGEVDLVDELHVHVDDEANETNPFGHSSGGSKTDIFDDVMRTAVIIAEDISEEAALKCQAMGIWVDYDELKNDYVDCFKKIVTTLGASVAKASLALHFRHDEFERIRQQILQGQLLTTQQEQLLLRDIFQPFCSAMMPAMFGCDNPKYKALAMAHACKPDFEKSGEEMAKTVIEDVCRKNGAWILEYLDAQPMKCAQEIAVAGKTKEHQERLRYLRGFKSDPARLGSSRRLESQAELCNATATLGSVIADLLVTPCKKSQPKPGKIILSTFKETRKFWTAKCGANTLGVGGSGEWWPVWTLSLSLCIALAAGFQCRLISNF